MRIFLLSWLGLLGLLPAQAQLPAARPALDSVRVRYDVPALLAAVIEPTRIRYVWAGVRRKYQSTPDSVQLGDYFHLGSDTKGVTSFLAAQLVEAGRLRWDSRLLEVISALQGQVLPAYARVTLGDLLAHRAGVPRSRNGANTEGSRPITARLPGAASPSPALSCNSRPSAPNRAKPMPIPMPTMCWPP
jgi:D-alanyl-D-alanine carboxypeptidase